MRAVGESGFGSVTNAVENQAIGCGSICKGVSESSRPSAVCVSAEGGCVESVSLSAKGAIPLDPLGIGQNGAWLYVMDRLEWGKIGNRRDLGFLEGMTLPPYGRGEINCGQG